MVLQLYEENGTIVVVIIVEPTLTLQPSRSFLTKAGLSVYAEVGISGIWHHSTVDSKKVEYGYTVI